ncbi:hypothetical protein LINPERHAP1_LOCUS18091 [Linum perenne]
MLINIYQLFKALLVAAVLKRVHLKHPVQIQIMMNQMVMVQRLRMLVGKILMFK